MKKLILLAIPVLLLTGCRAEPIEKDTNNYTYYIQDSEYFDFYIDKETCIEYIKYVSAYKGGITPRLNADGTPMLNEKCLKEVEE